jgi:hypothetical protein
MKSREFVAGLTLMSALSACSTNAIESSSDSDVSTPSTLVASNVGPLAVESSSSQIETLTPSVPSSTLPEIEFTPEDELADLRELAEKK